MFASREVVTLLAEPAFRRVWALGVATGIARWLETLAVGVYTYEATNSPFIVAVMTELLDVQPGDKVLEVGTGSGYQSAVLAEMGIEVYSVEIIPELADRARDVLANAGYDVRTRIGDGYFGWAEHAPFDGIIVTAAPDHVPLPLRTQLASGGKIVIPIGPPGVTQSLWLIEHRDGRWISKNQGPVRFVPFVREQ